MSKDAWNIKALNKLYEDSGPEKVGFIIDKKVVEVENIHPDSKDFFEVSLEDMEQHLDNATAIWHTQPGRTSQLSYEDYLGFLNFPEKAHIVIGLDGVRVYKVEDGQVIKESIHLREAQAASR